MFAALHFLPGDPTGRETHQSPQQYRQALHMMGLDQPLPVQYLHMIDRILHADLARRLVPEAAITGELALLAAIVALCLGNAALVVVTIAAPELTRLLVGSLVIEQVFAVPGLGHELIGSILSRGGTTPPSGCSSITRS